MLLHFGAVGFEGVREGFTGGGRVGLGGWVKGFCGGTVLVGLDSRVGDEGGKVLG